MNGLSKKKDSTVEHCPPCCWGELSWEGKGEYGVSDRIGRKMFVVLGIAAEGIDHELASGDS